MINKKYWDGFYKSNNLTIEESSFSKLTYNFIKENNLLDNKVLDIACGNGRDTFYFSKMNINSTGIDLSVKLKSKNPKFRPPPPLRPQPT